MAALRYKRIFFDLDGTLIDTAPGIIASMNRMLEIRNLPPINMEQHMALIGPPLQLGFSEVLGLSGEELSEAIRVYREIMPDISRELIAPFGGVIELLDALKRHGAFIGVITSKQQSTAIEQLDHFGIWKYVDYIMGAEPNGEGEKTALMKKADSEIAFDDDCVMIGDRFYDLNGAKAVGIASIGVSYGYAPVGELEGCKPTFIANTVGELQGLLLTD